MGVGSRELVGAGLETRPYGSREDKEDKGTRGQGGQGGDYQ
ncbi:hypothetical protein [Chroococcidiopsis sp. SAG 2025]|nr:hypothetical protein [Chroococcidiopsis sp. SAG 2025]